MRIAFISCLFPPEPEPAGVMSSQLARALQRDGHSVTMVVPFPNRPIGRAYADYRRSVRRIEDVDGVRVVRCPSWFVGPRRSAWSRALENVSFGVSAAINAALERRPEVVIVEAWPLAGTQICLWQARLRRVPVLYYVQDLYPEVLENLGIVRQNGCVARLLRRWDRHLCVSSDRVIAISNRMCQYMVATRNLARERIVVIPNWIQEEEFKSVTRDNAWRREMGISETTFVALYAGTHGFVSGADILVEVARRLRSRQDILLLCVGEGVLKHRMVEDARALSLSNIRFEPFQDRLRVPEMHAAADVCVLTMREHCSISSVPSKLISYMAAGRPVVCSVSCDSDVADAVTRANSGLVVVPGDPGALARALVLLRSRADLASSMGANARTYFEEHLAFRHRYSQFLAVLRDVVPDGPSTRSGIC